MAIYEELNDLDTLSSSSYRDYDFNGLLSDFIDSSSDFLPEFDPLFEQLVGLEPEVRVCSQLVIGINHKTISNQIIRYKDAFKLPFSAFRVPLILYWTKDGAERAMVLSTNTYIEAKGLYYCLTEPDSRFNDARNEIIAMALNEDTQEDVKAAFEEMLSGRKNVGAIQRMYDRKYLGSVDEMKDKAVELAGRIFDDVQQQLSDAQDREEIINDVIARVFLLKKAVYVQYMMNKDLLINRHENDVKKQRQFAKAYVDEIPIVSLSSLWRSARRDYYRDEEQPVVHEDRTVTVEEPAPGVEVTEVTEEITIGPEAEAEAEPEEAEPQEAEEAAGTEEPAEAEEPQAEAPEAPEPEEETVIEITEEQPEEAETQEEPAEPAEEENEEEPKEDAE